MADPSPELAAQLQTLASSYAEKPGRFFVPYAGLLREAGQRERAEEILRENIRNFPGLSAHVLLGRCLADRGAHPEAANEFHYVLSMDAQNLIALRTLAEMSAADGRTEEARRWYGELLSVDPMNAEARAAVGRLGAPGADAATADQPAGSDAAWGGADDDGAGALADLADRPADELEWGNLDLDAPAAETAEEPEEVSDVDELGFGEVELGGELPDLPWSGGEARQDLGAAEHGELPLLDFGSAAEEEDAAGEPAPLPLMDEEPEVVTETMAELYASQGLPERAAEVYRELIGRRGREPGLLRRLAELEGGAEPEAAAEEPEPAADRDDFAESVSAGFAPEASEERADWEAPEVTEEGETAGFDLVVIDDSTELDGDAYPPASAEEAAELSADWAVAAAPLEEQEEEVESASPAPAGRTMRGYFDALLGWAPTDASAVAAPAFPAAPAGGEEPEEPVFAVELEEPAPQEEPVFMVELEEPAPAAEPEEALPWELPAETPAEEAAPEPEPAPAVEGGFSFEDFFAGEPAPEAEPEAAPAAAPAPAPSPPAPAPGGTEAAGAAGAAGEEDEDLESFQAWLQSLKR